MQAIIRVLQCPLFILPKGIFKELSELGISVRNVNFERILLRKNVDDFAKSKKRFVDFLGFLDHLRTLSFGLF